MRLQVTLTHPAAAFAAMLALGLQTDVIGVPWVVYVLWPLAGWRMSHPEV